MKKWILFVVLALVVSPAFADGMVEEPAVSEPTPVAAPAPEPVAVPAPAPAVAKKPSKPYLETIFTDPAHPQVSAGVTFNSKFALTGGVTMVAPVYHRGDPESSLIPKVLQDAGIAPVSWALNVGVGGSEGNFVVPFGISANLTPTILGPALKAMNASGNSTAKGIASIISSPAGGVAFGPTWTATPMQDGLIKPLNQWSFPPGWFVGGLWKF